MFEVWSHDIEQGGASEDAATGTVICSGEVTLRRVALSEHGIPGGLTEV